MASSQSTMVGTGNPVLKWVLRLLVVGYLFLLVAWPTSLIVRRAFEGGIAGVQGRPAATRTSCTPSS